MKRGCKGGGGGDFGVGRIRWGRKKDNGNSMWNCGWVKWIGKNFD